VQFKEIGKINFNFTAQIFCGSHPFYVKGELACIKIGKGYFIRFKGHKGGQIGVDTHHFSAAGVIQMVMFLIRVLVENTLLQLMPDFIGIPGIRQTAVLECYM